ncbi:MAG TPA: RagB/SusD family nutrient uptake outer membrane protein [Chitinophagaceae bacterium]|nr:RagB/SusD family nutrient uptake outer membrane protein [Chitinophagaceae bacterium]
MNRNIIKIAIAILFLIPLSCKKNFLQQQNYTQLSRESYFTKESDAVALVNSIYDTYQNADLLKKSLWYYANFQTHDFFNWGNDRFYNYFDIQTNFGPMRVFWQRSYVGIARANTAIEVIPEMKTKGTISTAMADRLLGEAYFLRGLTYYYLGGSFGGVPLELKSATNGLTPRSSQDSVFAHVVSDMQQASSLLPWKEDYPAAEKGRATRGAALAYQGAARMWIKDYAGALTNFNALEGKYILLPNFADVNEYSKENNAESIFEVQFAVNGTQSWGAGNEVAWISDFSWPEEVSNFGYDYGNPGLYLSYQPGDTRKLLTILGPGDSSMSPDIIARGGIRSYPLVKSGFASTNPATKIKYTGDDGKIINTVGTKSNPWYGSDGDGLRTGFYCAKMWRDPTLDANSGNGLIFGAQNQILMRYAEALLSKAECQVRTGATAAAMATLKRVRDRAWGGTAPAVMQDGARYDGSPAAPITDPLQMVFSEYRHELTGEYSVFYNLRRAGVASAFVNAAYGTQNNNTNMIVNPAKSIRDEDPDNGSKPHGLYNTSMTPGKELYPIPELERGLNPTLTQNPGYN